MVQWHGFYSGLHHTRSTLICRHIFLNLLGTAMPVVAEIMGASPLRNTRSSLTGVTGFPEMKRWNSQVASNESMQHWSSLPAVSRVNLTLGSNPASVLLTTKWMCSLKMLGGKCRNTAKSSGLLPDARTAHMPAKESLSAPGVHVVRTHAQGEHPRHKS